MAATIPDLNIPNDQFVDINTLSGIPIGTAFTVINKGSHNIVLQESVLQPDSESEDGVVLTSIYYPYARGDIRAGSLAIWARVTGVDDEDGDFVSCKLSVQSV